MNKLGFILGRERELSLAEINAVLERESIDFSVDFLTREVLIISTDNPKLSEIKIAFFGGVIKLFEIIAEDANDNEIPEILENIQLPQTEKRINFGISSYGRIGQQQVFKLGKKIKESLIANDLQARFVTGKYKDLTSVIVHENKLIERGFEAILIDKNNKYIIGKTLEVQDYKLYSKFDYGRPYRDDKAGMIPPKLAQIMLNLSKAKTSEVVYDPFCGSGTVLTEAQLLDFEKVFGSDVSEKAVHDSKANLRWVEQIFDTKLVPEENIFTSDVLTPTKVIKSRAIVGEGYLGEPIRRNKDQAMKDAKILAEFYELAVKNLEKMLEEKGRIVLAIPFFIIGNEFIYLPIQNMNLKKIESLKKFDQKLPGRGNLTYFRKDQFVGREILVLEN